MRYVFLSILLVLIVGCTDKNRAPVLIPEGDNNSKDESGNYIVEPQSSNYYSIIQIDDFDKGNVLINSDDRIITYETLSLCRRGIAKHFLTSVVNSKLNSAKVVEGDLFCTDRVDTETNNIRSYLDFTNTSDFGKVSEAQRKIVEQYYKDKKLSELVYLRREKMMAYDDAFSTSFLKNLEEKLDLKYKDISELMEEEEMMKKQLEIAKDQYQKDRNNKESLDKLKNIQKQYFAIEDSLYERKSNKSREKREIKDKKGNEINKLYDAVQTKEELNILHNKLMSEISNINN